jgi:hypothetical protein
MLLSLFQLAMFSGAIAFNQDIGAWNVSSGIVFVSMERSFGFLFNTKYACDFLTNDNFLFLSFFQRFMFNWSIAFNQDIGAWDVSSVIDFVSTERSFGFLLNMDYAFVT